VLTKELTITGQRMIEDTITTELITMEDVGDN
jgi:hypothetical protein